MVTVRMLFLTERNLNVGYASPQRQHSGNSRTSREVMRNMSMFAATGDGGAGRASEDLAEHGGTFLVRPAQRVKFVSLSQADSSRDREEVGEQGKISGEGVPDYFRSSPK